MTGRKSSLIVLPKFEPTEDQEEEDEGLEAFHRKIRWIFGDFGGIVIEGRLHTVEITKH